MPCDQPHSAEVTAAWQGDQPDADLKDFYAGCEAPTAAYLAADTTSQVAAFGKWGPPPVEHSISLAQGPTATDIPGWSWRACLVQPLVAKAFATGYTGRLADVSMRAPAPPDLRICYFHSSAGLTGLPCTTDHLGEILASQQVQIAGEPQDGPDRDVGRLTSCRAVAQQATGRGDPTYGGALSLVVNLEVVGGGFSLSRSTVNAQQTVLSAFTVYVASCTLEVRGDHRLLGSLVGLGDGPLPIR